MWWNFYNRIKEKKKRKYRIWERVRKRWRSYCGENGSSYQSGSQLIHKERYPKSTIKWSQSWTNKRFIFRTGLVCWNNFISFRWHKKLFAGDGTSKYHHSLSFSKFSNYDDKLLAIIFLAFRNCNWWFSNIPQVMLKVMADFCDVVGIALINFGRSSVNNNVSDLISPSSHSVKVIDPFLVSVFILYPLKMGSQKTWFQM